MDPALAAIVGTAVGVLGAGAFQWWIAYLERRERRRDHRRGVLEAALHDAQRERRMLHVGYNLWRHGLPLTDPRVLDTDRSVAAAIEAVWISESEILVEFGDPSPQWAAFEELTQALDALKRIYDRNPPSATPLPAAATEWREAVSTVVRAQKTFVQAIRTTD